MAELLGFTGITLVVLLTLFLALRWPMASRILIVALVVRVAAILFGYFVAPLPDSGADARTFERVAWEWSHGGFLETLGHFPGPDAYLISWILAVLYSITDRSILMAQSLSLLFGMGTVFVGWMLVKNLWGDSVAAKAGWVLAMFPTLILYSALILREAYICFFLVVALYGVVSWVRIGGIKHIVVATIGFLGATSFHGAMILGLIVFIIIIGVSSLKKIVINLSRFRINFLSFFMVLLATFGLSLFFSGGIKVQYLGSFDRMIDLESFVSRASIYSREKYGEPSAAYPQWTVPNSPAEILYKGPIRLTYFIFAPFPWDVRSASHLIGFFDGLLYMALVFLIWRNRKAIWADRAARTIVLILAVYLLVFGLAIGNFGTGIRHRAKFVVGLILLAAPLLPKLVLFKKRNCSIALLRSIKQQSPGI